jgi:hypothetical protein
VFYITNCYIAINQKAQKKCLQKSKTLNPGVADGPYFSVTKNILTKKVPYFTVTKKI